jgi:excinuclease UvrABC ATPase subunit
MGCNSAGVVYTELTIMASVASICEECAGKRFDASVLDYKLGGRDISEVLAMPVADAKESFSGAGSAEARAPAAHKILERVEDVGLGYVSFGQPLTTLSGGERQRLKLATRMGDDGGVYVLDEPTTGLHLADIEQLLDRLVDSGKSIIVIEHHQAVMAHADWIIDLGPGAGHDGGRVVFEGTPAELVAARSTLTGEHLAAYVAA